MINFRFHIVSLIAVFLALSLGIVMGSVVVNHGIVDSLGRRVDRVEHENNDVRKTNSDLRKQLDANQAFVDQGAPLLVQHRLAGITVAVVAIRGIDGPSVKSAVDMLRTGGARVPAVVWLEPVWSLTDASSADKLAAALGTPPAITTAPTSTVTTARGATTTLPPAVEALRRDGLRFLANRLTTAPRRAVDALLTLQGAGFIALDGAGAAVPDAALWPTVGRVVVLGGDDTNRLSLSLALPAVSAVLDAGANAELGEVFKATPKSQRGDVVNVVRRDQALATRVATVDDVDVTEGRVALVLSLEELGRGVVGHYGVTRTAKHQVPTPPTGP